jgi:hypothetical protein
MSTLHAVQRKRAKLAVETQRTMYRHELGTAGAQRQEHLQGVDAASQRIVQLLPGAKEAGVSIADMARLTGYSRPTIYRILAEARPQYDFDTEFARWARALDSASDQVGHQAMLNEFADCAGIDVDQIRAQLTRLFDYAVTRLDALDPSAAVTLLELLPSLPHVEKIILTQIFCQRMSLGEVARSLDQPNAEVIVWAVLALLRVLPQLEEGS